MDEDYQASNDRDADEWYDQDGPDLFGQDEPPRDELRDSGSTDQTDPQMSASEPEQDADAAAEEPAQPDDVLAGPESPAEPDGLDTDEQDDPFDPCVVDRVAELTEPAGVTGDGAPDPSDPPGESDASSAPGGTVESRDTSVQNPPLALYRRYRPDTFDEVIGQEHVTEPLKRAIVNGRVNHAYLFSGPRGCGKTTSARILARCLNCEQGPTPYPCGECQSCRDLARGGPGSIDVIEIDAASHGGVDEARDLRERAFFAPVRSRYKIYIIDEAHMVTTQGFNAMLKLVEEPPPHVKFIFATTEPEKVIGTIRSRTHHYPFRLVPPATLVNYLETLCDKEGIAVDHAVLPMVVRAGGGSVRDSLSVLDQLLGGADEDGVSYELAAALLGYTPDALLDQVVDAFAAGDAHEVFATIDKVMDMGQDPRRFAEDLLRRMRDLVILAAVPDAVNNRLIDVSPEQGERLAHQAAAMGAGELTRAAEVLATGLTQMRGTTAPRLHLELMCSRILLPDADTDERGVHARLDRLERRVGIVGAGAAGSGDLVEVESSHDETAQHQRWPSGERPARPGRPASAPRGGDPALGESSRDGGSAPATARQGSQPGARTTPSPDPTERPRRPRPGRADYRPTGAGTTAPQEPQAPSQSMTGQAGSREDPRAAQSQTPAQSTTSAQSSTPEQSQAPMQQRSASEPPTRGRPPHQQPSEAASSGARPVDPSASAGPAVPSAGSTAERPDGVDVTMLRDAWPRIIEVFRSEYSRYMSVVLNQYAQILGINGNQATLGFSNPGARDSYLHGDHAKHLHDVVAQLLGVDVDFVPVTGDVQPLAHRGHDERRTRPDGPRPGSAGAPGRGTPDARSRATGANPHPQGSQARQAGPAGGPPAADDDSTHGADDADDIHRDAQSTPPDVSPETNNPVQSNNPMPPNNPVQPPDASPQSRADTSDDENSSAHTSSVNEAADVPESGQTPPPHQVQTPAEVYPESARSRFLDPARRRLTSQPTPRGAASRSAEAAGRAHRFDAPASGQTRPTAHDASGQASGTGGHPHGDFDRHVPSEPPADDMPPDDMWELADSGDGEILDSSGESAIELITTELGGVVLTDERGSAS